MQSLFWLKFSNFVAYTVMTPKSDGKTLYKRAKKSHNLFGWLFVFWIHSKLKVSYDIASINLHFRPFLCFIRVSCTSKTKIILRVFGKYLLFHCCWLEMVLDVVFMVNFLSPQIQILEKFLFRSYGPNSSWSIKQLNSWIRNASKRIERLFQFLTYRSTSKRKTNILYVGVG